MSERMRSYTPDDIQAEATHFDLVDALPVPPAISPHSLHTQFYCEENAYILAQTFEETNAVTCHWDVFVIFVSNPTKTIALWNQKASIGGNPGGAVVWDYHVFLALRPRCHALGEGDVHGTDDRSTGTWIYDFDSLSPIPCAAQDYLTKTCLLGQTLPEEYRSLFRVVPSQTCIQHFASDRSHMLARPGEYIKPPPAYPPLRGPGAHVDGIVNNLMSDFVDMSVQKYGTVMKLEDLAMWCTSR
ncbi:N-terminal glutamine amidase-domain-containing protein [Amylostereum chailletii]|nr:N-terminal glutamine amidase-domain-containing protein [Amylostereum chailletii]